MYSDDQDLDNPLLAIFEGEHVQVLAFYGTDWKVMKESGEVILVDQTKLSWLN